MEENNLVVLPTMNQTDSEPEQNIQPCIVSSATKKLDEEEKAFVGGFKAKLIFPHVCKTLRGFIDEDDRFAKVFANTARTVSECCAAIVDKSGDALSDLEVYRKAVQFYFPNADVEFKMNVRITGDAPTEEEMKKPAEIKAVPDKPKPAPKPTPKDKAADKPEESKTVEKQKRKASTKKEEAYEDDAMQLTLWG